MKSVAGLEKPGISRGPRELPRRKQRRADSAGKGLGEKKRGPGGGGVGDTYKGKGRILPPRKLIRKRGAKGRIAAVRVPMDGGTGRRPPPPPEGVGVAVV